MTNRFYKLLESYRIKAIYAGLHNGIFSTKSNRLWRRYYNFRQVIYKAKEGN